MTETSHIHQRAMVARCLDTALWDQQNVHATGTYECAGKKSCPSTAKRRSGSSWHGLCGRFFQKTSINAFSFFFFYNTNHKFTIHFVVHFLYDNNTYMFAPLTAQTEPTVRISSSHSLRSSVSLHKWNHVLIRGSLQFRPKTYWCISDVIKPSGILNTKDNVCTMHFVYYCNCNFFISNKYALYNYDPMMILWWSLIFLI